MTEFVPIVTEGLSDREVLEALAKGQNLTHACVHSLQAEQQRQYEEGRTKRHALANGMTRLEGQMRTFGKKLGAVQATQELDSGRITKLSKVVGAETWRPGEKRVRPKAPWPAWKLAATALASLSGAVLAYQILWPVIVALHQAILRAAT